MVPPKPPFSTNEDEHNENAKTPLLEDIDTMSPEQLAEYLYALAEEIIASPLEYKMKMGLEQLDIGDLDNIDLSTPAGRKKLAALFRLLAEQVLHSKARYQSTVVDKSKPQGRGTGR